MAKKLVLEFLHDWIHDENLRKDVLYQEDTKMKAYGLKMGQTKVLKDLDEEQIAKLILEELGINIDDLREAVHPGASETGGATLAGYDEGKTHIRRVLPKVIPVGNPASPPTKIVLMGQGFKSEPSEVITEFRTIPPGAFPDVTGTVKEITSDIDVWQRVSVEVNLTQTGEWQVRARNNGETDWSDPSGKIFVVG